MAKSRGISAASLPYGLILTGGVAANRLSISASGSVVKQIGEETQL